jgi:hypothetical protein
MWQTQASRMLKLWAHLRTILFVMLITYLVTKIFSFSASFRQSHLRYDLLTAYIGILYVTCTRVVVGVVLATGGQHWD